MLPLPARGGTGTSCPLVIHHAREPHGFCRLGHTQHTHTTHTGQGHTGRTSYERFPAGILCARHTQTTSKHCGRAQGWDSGESSPGVRHDEKRSTTHTTHKRPAPNASCYSQRRFSLKIYGNTHIGADIMCARVQRASHSVRRHGGVKWSCTGTSTACTYMTVVSVRGAGG